MKNDTVYIRAYIESATPEPNQWKPYSSTLTFEGKLAVDVPVPSSEVTTEKGVQILTLLGWKTFLINYSKIIKQIPQELYK